MLRVLVVDVTPGFDSLLEQVKIACPSCENDKLVCCEAHFISMENAALTHVTLDGSPDSTRGRDGEPAGMLVKRPSSEGRPDTSLGRRGRDASRRAKVGE